MRVKVHRMRDKGEKLPTDVSRLLHFSGMLSFGKVDGESRAAVAHDGTGEPIAMLFKARVSRIDRAGFLIRGIERAEDGAEHRQDWWCLVG